MAANKTNYVRENLARIRAETLLEGKIAEKEGLFWKVNDVSSRLAGFDIALYNTIGNDGYELVRGHSEEILSEMQLVNTELNGTYKDVVSGALVSIESCHWSFGRRTIRNYQKGNSYDIENDVARSLIGSIYFRHNPEEDVESQEQQLEELLDGQ